MASVKNKEDFVHVVFAESLLIELMASLANKAGEILVVFDGVT